MTRRQLTGMTMENTQVIVNHIGYAVHSIVESTPFFEGLGFVAKTTIIQDYAQHVNVQLFCHNITNICIEILEPQGEVSPIYTMLRKHGPRPYHICYEYIYKKDEKLYTDMLQNFGLRRITPKTFSPVFKKYVAFYFSKTIGIIEFMTK